MHHTARTGILWRLVLSCVTYAQAEGTCMKPEAEFSGGGHGGWRGAGVSRACNRGEVVVPWLPAPSPRPCAHKFFLPSFPLLPRIIVALCMHPALLIRSQLGTQNPFYSLGNPDTSAQSSKKFWLAMEIRLKHMSKAPFTNIPDVLCMINRTCR